MMMMRCSSLNASGRISRQVHDVRRVIPSIARSFPSQQESTCLNASRRSFRSGTATKATTLNSSFSPIYQHILHPTSVHDESIIPSSSVKSLRIAVVGDVHDAWDEVLDPVALQALDVDFVIFLGDFGNENIEVVRQISSLQQPFAAILGNHDAWYSMGSRQRNGRAMQLLAAANAQAARTNVSQLDSQPASQESSTYQQQQQQQQQQQIQPPLQDGVSLQMSLLGSSHVGYSSMRIPGKDLAVVGARPFSKGGSSFSSIAGFMQRLYGIGSMHQSAEKVVQIATKAASCPSITSTAITSPERSEMSHNGTHHSSSSSHSDGCSDPTDQADAAKDAKHPISLIMVSHCGPSGLGDQAFDCVGVDWTGKGGDHGDPDLQAAMSQLHQTRVHIPLVLFGHMHNRLHKSSSLRRMVAVDPVNNTVYLNAATVPRIRPSPKTAAKTLAPGPRLQRHHFLVVKLEGGEVMQASDVWVEMTEPGYRQPINSVQREASPEEREQARIDTIEAERVARALAYEQSRPKAPANISPRQRREWHRREQEAHTAHMLSEVESVILLASSDAEAVAERVKEAGGSDDCGSASTSSVESEEGGSSEGEDESEVTELRARIVEESCVLRSAVGEGGVVRFAWDAYDQQWRPVMMHQSMQVPV